MKIAYIILAHKLPEQLVRLVRALNTDTASFFIHIDKKTDAETCRKMTVPLSEYKNVYFLERFARYYGDFNHVRPTLDGIRKLLELGLEYDYVILLTGQDYPIKSNAQIRKTLNESEGKSFMEYFSLPDKHWENENGGLDRIVYFYLHWRGWEFPFLKKTRLFGFIPDSLWSIMEKLLPMRRNFPGNYRLYGGSSYWCLSRECIEYLDIFVRQNSAFVKFFEHVKIPDETFFQTVLMNSPLKDTIVNNNLRYIVWGNSRHPLTLRQRDFQDFMNTDNLFARKFDISVDRDVLDMIDQSIL